jgi:hypothetical protein
MAIVVRHCNCLKVATSRVRDMLIAEGFQVTLRPTLRPLTLQVIAGEKEVWSYALWRRQIPDQQKLAEMVRAVQ